MPDTTSADDLAFALRLADIADAISLPRFGALDLMVERSWERSSATPARHLQDDDAG
jgi:histidinol-phosphatase